MEFPDAKMYNDSNDMQMKHAKDTIQELLKGELKEFDIIVDVGCGSGNVTQVLSKLVPHEKIFALDHDPNMIEFAKSKYNDEKIEWFLDDIGLQWNDLSSTMKELEGRVSLVWSNYVLHWVDDKGAAIKTIAKLLKPGGRCYLNVPNIRYFNEFLPLTDREENERFIKYPTLDEDLHIWNKILSDSGLSSFNILKIPVVWKSNVAWKFLVDGSDSVVKKYLNKSIAQEKNPEYLEKFKNVYLRVLATQPGQPVLPELPTNPTGYFVQYVVTGIK